MIGRTLAVGVKAAACSLRGLRSTLDQLVEGGRKLPRARGKLSELPDMAGPSHDADAPGPAHAAAALDVQRRSSYRPGRSVSHMTALGQFLEQHTRSTNDRSSPELTHVERLNYIRTSFRSLKVVIRDKRPRHAPRHNQMDFRQQPSPVRV